jgi:hypothetical protein
MSVSGIITGVVYNDGTAYVVINGVQVSLGDIVSVKAAEES